MRSTPCALHALFASRSHYTRWRSWNKVLLANLREVGKDLLAVMAILLLLLTMTRAIAMLRVLRVHHSWREGRTALFSLVPSIGGDMCNVLGWLFSCKGIAVLAVTSFYGLLVPYVTLTCSLERPCTFERHPNHRET